MSVYSSFAFKFRLFQENAINIVMSLVFVAFCRSFGHMGLEVRSLNHPYSIKSKSSQCHDVVMTRSETKFLAPLNRRCQATGTDI